MKRSILRSLVSRREWRSDGVRLAFLLLIWSFCYPVTAQVQTTRRVTTLRADNEPQGSKVTVVSDAELNDYEAYRRGDRFYVKVPAARLGGSKPKLRGKGFDDVTVQKAGTDVIFSFRLQPGTAAKVNPRTNGLDVIFSIPGGSQTVSNPPAQVPNPTRTETPASEVSQPQRLGGSLATGEVSGAAQVTSTTPTRAQDPVSQNSVGLETTATEKNENLAGQGSEVSRDSSNNDTTQTANASPVSDPNAQSSSARVGESPAANPDKRSGVFPESWPARLLVPGILVVLISFAFFIVRWKRRERKDLSDNTASPLPAVSTLDLERKLVVVPPVGSLEEFAGIDVELNKMLGGNEYDGQLIDVSDTATRQAIEERLLAALSGPVVAQHKPARRAFVTYGYFAELVAQLRSADSPAERAIAAAKLGRVGDSQATSYLIEALNDHAPEVRRAVVESLRRLADPDLMASLSDLLSRERNRQLSSSLIREAIQASGSRTSVAEKFDTSEGDQTKIAKAATASSGGSRESHSEISPANLDES